VTPIASIPFDFATVYNLVKLLTVTSGLLWYKSFVPSIFTMNKRKRGMREGEIEKRKRTREGKGKSVDKLPTVTSGRWHKLFVLKNFTQNTFKKWKKKSA
jgi:hypothetical protein